MKTLKIVAVALVALVVASIAGFWFFGGMDGRWRYTTSVTIERPAAEIFQWLVEPDRQMRWVGGFQEVMPFGDNGPRVGARSRGVIVSGGERFELETRITEFNPPSSLGVHIAGAAFESVAGYELRESAGRTDVRYFADTQFHGLTFQILEPLIVWSAEAKIGEDLARLKELVEAPEPPATSGEETPEETN